MAFKIDFAKLALAEQPRRSLSTEERNQLADREQFGDDARAISKDEKDRDTRSKELRVLTVVDNPDIQYGLAGEKTATLYYDKSGEVSKDDYQKWGRAIYKAPEAEAVMARSGSGTSDLDSQLATLRVGDKVTVLGESKKRYWQDHEEKWHSVTEFHATRMAPGVHTREMLMARTAGGLAEAAESYVTASSDRQREVIARKYLQQEPLKEPVSMAKGPEIEEREFPMLMAIGREGR